MHTLLFKIKKFFPESIKVYLRKLRESIFIRLDKNKPYLNKIKYCDFDIFYTKNAGLIDRIRTGSTQKIYEPEFSKKIYEEIKDIKNPQIIDIGTNIGLISAYLLSQKDDLKIFGFEPSPIAYKSLSTTIFANKLEDRFVLQNTAISDTDSLISFFTHSDMESSGDGMRDTGRGKAIAKEITIESTTLDAWWNKNNMPKIDLIKIDIEGSELLALKGSVNLINKLKPKIFIEISTENLKVYPYNELDIIKFIHSIQYNLETIDGLECTELNIKEIVESADSFIMSPNK